MKKYIVIEDHKKKECTIFYGKEETRVFFDLYLTALNIKTVSYFNSIGKSDTEMIHDMARLTDMSFMVYEDCSKDKKKKYRSFIGYAGIIRLLGFLFDLNYIESTSDIYDWVVGELCNIPECCIDKYIEVGPRKLADDYFHQLNGKKDIFNLKDNGHKVTSDYLNFIPCSPHCQEAKMRHISYKKLWKQMFDNYSVSAAELKKGGLPESGKGMETYNVKR
jgi:hypothetical protein